MKALEAQSAMEYLMTYGWAILIIAVILGALFGLGFFNSANLAPKVGPGSCQVYRPNGPGTTTFINLEGTCNNELPQYVAKFSAPDSYVNATLSFPTAAGQSLSVSVWVDMMGACQSSTFYCGVVDADNGVSGWGLMAGPADADFWTKGGQDMFFKIPQNQWVDMAVVYQYNGGSPIVNMYLNGQVANTVSANVIVLPVPFGVQIGQARQTTGMTFNGLVSNVQIYNSSISANEVSAIYQEGIGGAPIPLQSLVGWWPLNGNADDYSGNLNNGVSTNVVFTSSWTGKYVAP